MTDLESLATAHYSGDPTAKEDFKAAILALPANSLRISSQSQPDAADLLYELTTPEWVRGLSEMLGFN